MILVIDIANTRLYNMCIYGASNLISQRINEYGRYNFRSLVKLSDHDGLKILVNQLCSIFIIENSSINDNTCFSLFSPLFLINNSLRAIKPISIWFIHNSCLVIYYLNFLHLAFITVRL